MKCVACRCAIQWSFIKQRRARAEKKCRSESATRAKYALFAAAVLLAAFAPPVQQSFAQSNTPHIETVDPTSGKVGDAVTVTGGHLGKGAVAGVFLSDDKSDYKATLVDQADEKIVFKVPQVKPGRYNVSVQSGAEILILPVRFTVVQ